MSLGRRFYFALSCLIFPAFLFAKEPIANSNPVGFLYIASNSGQSSGGHSALRIGNRVYHLQYSFEDKIFYIIREPWENFRFLYSVVQNRNIEFYEWKLSKIAKREFQRKWDELYLIQKKYLNNINSLKEEYKFYSQWISNNQTEIDGLGYFTEIKSEREKEELALSNSEKYHIEKSLEILQKELRVAFDTEGKKANPIVFKSNKLENKHWLDEENFSEFFPPQTIETGANRLQNLIRKIQIRKWILEPTLPYLPAFFSFHFDEDLKVKEEDQVWLKNIQTQLREDFISCIKNQNCNDWEELSLLVRYISIGMSRDLGVFTFPMLQTKKLPHQTEFEIPEWLREKKNLEYKQAFYELKKEMIAGYNFATFLEWERFNLKWYLFFQKGNEGFLDLWTPNLPGNVSLQEFSQNTNNVSSDVSSLETTLFQIQSEYQKKVQEIYSYHLIFKNCTGELFRYQNHFFPDQKILDETIGERISHEPRQLNFIPAIAAKRVESHTLTTRKKIYLSFRNLYLNEKRRNKVESWKDGLPNLSPIYKSNPFDHSFLFFTDDKLYSRPLYGLANLVWGIGYIAKGILWIPVDYGETVSKGSESIFYSLPELVFFNIRKGHFPYITIDEIPEEYYHLEKE
ncbi:MAG: hypothetical protein O9301_10980 [Leptospira sp.]|nr:hypothetical protein [Leptospira sp.]